MDSLFYWTGAALWLLVGVALAWLIAHIAGNIYGGFIGYRRYRRLYHEARPDVPPASLRQSIAAGLGCWAGGNRYEKGLGSYWEIGCQKVPVDGRSPLPPEKIYG